MSRWHLTTSPIVILALVWLCLPAAARAQQPEDVPPLQQAFVLWQEGYVLHLAGEYEMAALLFRRSIEAHPTAEGHTFLGWSLSHLGRIEEAIAECKSAIEIDPDYGNPYNDIGVYLIDLGRPDEAIDWLEKATRADRYCCYQYPHFNLGRIQLMKGQLEEAEHSFERALSYDPDYLPAQLAIQILREHKGEPL